MGPNSSEDQMKFLRAFFGLDDNEVVAQLKQELAATRQAVINANKLGEYNTNLLQGQLKEATAKLVEVERLNKNLAPVGRYNGKDIEFWYQAAQTSGKAAGTLRKFLEEVYVDIVKLGSAQTSQARQDLLKKIEKTLAE
jgi:hypothetical protein